MLPKKPTAGKRLVICTHIVKSGKVIYPKNGKFFAFEVDDSKPKKT